MRDGCLIDFIRIFLMMEQVDAIISLCQNTRRELSNTELRQILLKLALSHKQLLVQLQQAGIIKGQNQNPWQQPQQQQNQWQQQQQFQGGGGFMRPQGNMHGGGDRLGFGQHNNLIHQLNKQLLKPSLAQSKTNPIRPNPSSSKLPSPICLAYIDRINQWWPPEGIAAGMGVPSYAKPTLYNYLVFVFWTYGGGALDIAAIWADPIRFFGGESCFGKSKGQVQAALKAKYNEKGIKIMVSAFGSTENPTSQGYDPIDCAQKLGKFVLENNLDGVDIDWQDNAAMQAGKGEEWLIKFQTRLRKLLPSHIITHAPQAPYFKKQHYKNGAYITVDSQVGQTIDFYNIQFYNQGDTSYSSYQTLFQKSGSYFSGTSVTEIAGRGIPLNKIVIGKPVTQGDVCNTGLVGHEELGKWIGRAKGEYGWGTGVMYWQYISDLDGVAIGKSMGELMRKG